MLDQIDAFFSLVERFKRWRGKRGQSESAAGRFLRLFESHGVHRNQIPRFFGQGLTLKDVQSEQTLLPCLSVGMMDEACRLFGVRNAWLERGELLAHERPMFYLDAVGFGAYLDGISKRRSVENSAGIANIALTARLYGGFARTSEVQSTLVIFEPVGLLGDDVICRHHLIDTGPLGYWKARVSTASLVAQAIERDIWVQGRLCEAVALQRILTDKDLPHADDWVKLDSSRRFEPDAWLIRPEALLEDLDPEQDNFGYRSGLELWLSLHEQGRMGHRHASPNVREIFKAALKMLYK